MLIFNGLVLSVSVASAALAWLRAELGWLGVLGVVLAIAFQAAIGVVSCDFCPDGQSAGSSSSPGRSWSRSAHSS